MAQGGDLGYFVCRFPALKYSDYCKAHHTNMPVPHAPDHHQQPTHVEAILAAARPLTAEVNANLAAPAAFMNTGSAYAMIHTTRPQTIGYLLADSPVGFIGMAL